MYEQSVTGHALCLFFVTLCGQATGAYDVIGGFGLVYYIIIIILLIMINT